MQSYRPEAEKIVRKVNISLKTKFRENEKLWGQIFSVLRDCITSYNIYNNKFSQQIYNNGGSGQGHQCKQTHENPMSTLKTSSANYHPSPSWSHLSKVEVTRKYCELADSWSFWN